MSSKLALGSTQPPTQWVKRELKPGAKRPGSETNHSPPTSAKVKITWIDLYIHYHKNILGAVLNEAEHTDLTFRIAT
jgi:hypothetical protein